MIRRVALTLGLIVLVTGCFTRSKHVVFASALRAGVEVSTLETGQQVAAVGYSRNEGVTMPARDATGAAKTQAYSVLALSRLDTGSLMFSTQGSRPLELRQVFVTGKAARVRDASKAVVNSFEARVTGKISSPEANRLGGEAIDLVEKLGADGRRERVLVSVGEELGTVSTLREALDLIRDAANDDRVEALTRLRDKLEAAAEAPR